LPYPDGRFRKRKHQEAGRLPMDPIFDALLTRWHDFFLATAAGAATFTGLLFVAISYNLNILIQDEKMPLRSATKLAFALFLTVFFAALLLLLPDESAGTAAWALGGVGLVALLLPGSHVAQLVRGRADYAWARVLLPWFVTPALLDILLIRCAFALSAGDPTALVWLAGLLMAMLFVAALASWRLLVDVAHGKHAASAAPDSERAKGLERQIRALVREQRAQNRALREAQRTAPPPPPRDRATRG
jgi:modulator of FtsH protease